MASRSLLARRDSYLYTAWDPAHDGVHTGAVFGFGPQCVVGQAHRGDVLRARKLAGGVGQVADVWRHKMPDMRLAGERQAGRPMVLDHLERQLGKQTATAAEIDVGWKPFPACELFHAERQPLQEHLRVRAKKLRDLAVLLCRK